MREILLRGKRLEIGDWVEGSLIAYPDGDCYIARPSDDPNVLDKFCIDPATVGQYTGLKDKNGKQVFEGDLCLCDRHINDSFDQTVFEIMFDPLRGYYGESSWGSEFDGTSFDLCEIIGNIHDNPELLGRERDNDHR